MKRIDRIRRLNELLKYQEGYTIMDLMVKLDVAERTVRKDLEDIQKPPYNAVYWNEYRGKERLYRYKDTGFSLKLFDGNNDEVKKKLNEAIEAINLYKGTPQYQWLKLCLLAIENGGVGEMENVMSFENNADLEGLGHIESLTDAIVHKYPIKLTYKPYRAEEKMIYVHPYHLKQFNNRWFLIGTPEGKDGFYNYAVDRIVKVEHLSKKYEDADTDFDDYFYDVIGVSVTDAPLQRIELLVSKWRYPYILTKPLHGSQTTWPEKDTENEVCITIDVKPNRELIAMLLSFGPDVKVVSPAGLKQEIRKKAAELYNLYNE